MSLTPWQAFRLHVLAKCETAPAWTQSFKKLGTIIDQLATEGLIVRVPPPGGSARNMIQITDAGRERLATLKRMKAK